MSDAGHVRIFTWSMAEELAEGHMRHLGFSDARRTPPGVDGGFDVVASAAVAQVKHQTATVGAPELQRLRGAAHDGRAALFYSSSGYTRAAFDYAVQARVALFEYDTTSLVRAVNEAAAALEAAARGVASGPSGGGVAARTEMEMQIARHEAIRASNEQLELHVEAIMDAEQKYDEADLSVEAWAAQDASHDRFMASAQITNDWAMQILAASPSNAGRARTVLDYDVLIGIELSKRRKLLELFRLSPDDFPISMIP